MRDCGVYVRENLEQRLESAPKLVPSLCGQPTRACDRATYRFPRTWGESLGLGHDPVSPVAVEGNCQIGQHGVQFPRGERGN